MFGARCLVSSFVLVATALVGCGGSSQFDAKSPHPGSWEDLKSAMSKAADKMSCKSEDRGRNMTVTCTEPEYRSVTLMNVGAEELTWTCSMGKSGCRAFVDELLSKAK